MADLQPYEDPGPNSERAVAKSKNAMLGEFLFHKLRTACRLERVIDEIKRSPDDSAMREFSYFWGKLQEFFGRGT